MKQVLCVGRMGPSRIYPGREVRVEAQVRETIRGARFIIPTDMYAEDIRMLTSFTIDEIFKKIEEVEE